VGDPREGRGPGRPFGWALVCRRRGDGLRDTQRYRVRLKFHGNRTLERWLMPNDAAAHFNKGRRQRSIRGRLHEDTQFKVLGRGGRLHRPEQDA
jgi:hypothetical protein